jgi:hypothetical protein
MDNDGGAHIVAALTDQFEMVINLKTARVTIIKAAGIKAQQ